MYFHHSWNPLATLLYCVKAKFTPKTSPTTRVTWIIGGILPLKTLPQCRRLKKILHTHTHTLQRDGAATWKQSHRVRNFNFFWQTISGRFNQFQLKNLIVPAMNAPAEDAEEGAAAFLGAAAAMRRTTRLTIVCRVCQVESVESSRVGSGWRRWRRKQQEQQPMQHQPRQQGIQWWRQPVIVPWASLALPVPGSLEMRCNCCFVCFALFHSSLATVVGFVV